MLVCVCLLVLSCGRWCKDLDDRSSRRCCVTLPVPAPVVVRLVGLRPDRLQRRPSIRIPIVSNCRRQNCFEKIVESNRAHIVVKFSSSGPNTIFDFRKFKDFSIFGVFPLASTSIVMPEPHSAVGGRTIRAVSV